MRYLVTVIWTICLLPSLYGQDDREEIWEKWHFSVLLSADLAEGEVSPGLGIKTWYFVRPRVGIGPSLAYKDFSFIRDEKVWQTGLDIMYRQPLGKGWNALAGFEGGYGHLSIKNVENKKGGIYILPRAGLLVETARRIGIYSTVGYLRQPYEFTVIDFFPDPTITEVIIKRYDITLGLLF